MAKMKARILVYSAKKVIRDIPIEIDDEDFIKLYSGLETAKLLYKETRKTGIKFTKN